MRVVHLVYQIDQFAFCDVYLQGKILNTEEAIHDATTTLLKLRDDPKRKFCVVVFDSIKSCYAPGPKIMRQKGIFKLEHQVFSSVNQFEASRKTIDRIKMLILDESYKISKKRIIVDSSDGSDCDVPEPHNPKTSISSTKTTMAQEDKPLLVGVGVALNTKNDTKELSEDLKMTLNAKHDTKKTIGGIKSDSKLRKEH